MACLLLNKPLQHFPTAFYLVSIITTLLFVVSGFIDLPAFIDDPLFLLMRKCTLPLALFCVVMFIGVLPEKSLAKRTLKPIRGQLSIIAWVLSLGHMAAYAGLYVPRFIGKGTPELHMAASFAVAVVLFVLLLVLGATSFDCAKKRMSALHWLRIQRFAYAFFALTYAHVLLALGPASLHGGAASQESIATYTAVFVSYALLRFKRYHSTR